MLSIHPLVVRKEKFIDLCPNKLQVHKVHEAVQVQVLYRFMQLVFTDHCQRTGRSLL